MKSPFPGMDPYLERHWRDVHHRLCTYSCDELTGQISPALVARLDERVVLEAGDDWPGGSRARVRVPDVKVEEFVPYGIVAGGSDGGDGGVAVSEPILIAVDEVTEAFIRIIEPGSGKLITVIEFLSPTNKRDRGRRDYEAKQDELRGAGVNLVEVDLIREVSTWVHGVSEKWIKPEHRTTYRVFVTRPARGNWAELYPNRLGQRLPVIKIPLRESDPDAKLDLQAVLDKSYKNGTYWATIDYSKPCEPPLVGEEATIAEGLLRQAGKR